ncbi:anti-sigma factor family protein [Curvibacter gracilis]|uniref:anti-sigma factor family protein n=1 Tax=Curvibacter gracilis TaxID=230310 RepID=UPI0004820729|nr:hypothetical protein [Curvibacter gracilis]
MDPQDDELSALIRTQATRHHADDQLRARIRTQLLLASAAQPAASPLKPQRPAGSLLSLDLGGWRRLAAGFLLGVALTWWLSPHLASLNRPGGLEEALVADHVHSLRVGPLFQVESSDRHTVKPWFQGKLDYAPPVLDLAEADFPLVGGRVEHIDQNAVAALVYRHRGHVINLFVWPSERTAALQSSQIRGFNISHWSTAQMQFWAVSDMDAIELMRFTQALQTRL